MRVFVVAPVTLALFASVAHGAVLHVPADYPTIGAATTVAVSGDEVLVAPGTYHETFTLGPGQDGVKIHSESGPAVTIIDGGFTGPIVSMTLVGPGTELIGFTLVHGGHSPPLVTDFGGGVRLDRSSSLIQNNTFSQCWATRGALYLNIGSPVITRNVFDSNKSTEGGAIYVVAGAPTISTNTITTNQATSGRGGGIFCFSSSSSTITDNVVDRNTARTGGGIYLAGSAPAVTGNAITNNKATATGGGGIFVDVNTSPDVENNEIRGNQAAEIGGGMDWFGTGGAIRRNQFISNEADISGGGLIVLGSVPTIQGNRFESNSANNGGGGLYFAGSGGALVDSNQFIGNAGGGGAIYLTGATATIRLNLIQDNDCPHGSGGGIYVDQDSRAAIDQNVILRNHAAAWGGGVTVWASQATLTHNTVALNRGDLGGGNVHFRRHSMVTLQQNIFSHSPSDGIDEDNTDGPNTASLSCNDVSNNAGGNYSGLADPTGTNGNISSDPLFCNLAVLDVHLSMVSPCTATNAPAGCGLIGALDVGCEGPVRTEITTWGGLKARYR